MDDYLRSIVLIRYFCVSFYAKEEVVY